jgi:hypothetical protein
VQPLGRSSARQRDARTPEVEEVVMIPVTASSYDLIVPICEALDLGDPNLIRSIKLTPTKVEVEFFKLNADGEKHVDLETGWIATETHVIPVSP